MSNSLPEQPGRIPAPAEKPSPLRQAYAVIERLERELADARATATAEPIAVVGMGCRFPGGGANPDLYWEALRRGGDAVGPIPQDRWQVDDLYDPDPEAVGKIYARAGSFLPDVSGFDAAFFGVSPAEAMSLDPQQRLLLEVAWETLEHAGIAPGSLRQSRTGVFVGIGQSDYARRRLHAGALDRITRHDGTGNGFNFAPGRISHFLKLRGPSLAVDCACASSLVAVHLACQSLRAGECDLALAAGAQLILSPEVTVFLCRAKALSADGRCKTFDASADGFGRGEGAGMVALKRWRDALADGDRIWAVIRGSAINHDGPSSGLTVPSEHAQVELMERALSAAGLKPGAVSAIEAHGTGTPLGDPIEVGALAAVYARNRPPDATLWLGSAKTNHGHLEAAAGVAGLIKIVLSLHHRQLPPHLHWRQPSPHIPWERLPFRVPTELTEWTSPAGPRVAGISSFGFGGINSHVLVEEVPGPASHAGQTPAGGHLLVFSARSPEALRALAKRHAEYWKAHPGLDAPAACRTAALGRDHFAYRAALCFHSQESLEVVLRAIARGEAPSAVWTGCVPPGSKGAPSAALTLEQAAEDYVRGREMDWTRWFPAKRPPVTLPTYPFERQRFWSEAAPTAASTKPPEGTVETFEVAWVEREPSRSREQKSAEGLWLVLCSASGLGDAVASDLQECGGRCIRVRRGAETIRQTADEWLVAPTGDDPFAGLLRGLGAAPVAGVVHAWEGGPGIGDWRASREAGVGSALRLLQGLRRAGGASPPRLFLLTRANPLVGGGMAEVGLAGGLLDGLGRSLALEWPENWGGLYDVPEEPSSADIRAVVGEMLATVPLDEAAWREGRPRVPRLRRRQASGPASPLALRAEGAYWVTGGWGALGLRVARWLVERGAGTVVLSARSEPNTEVRAFADAATSRGTPVLLRRVDVGDPGAVAGLVREIGRGPCELRGIFHAAGEAGCLPADELTLDDLHRVCRAKVEGAWNLHQMTRAAELDHFVLFSSIAATWGSKTQAHYGAANGFLDALAGWRHRQELPALSVAWGPWGGGGLVDAEVRRTLERRGLTVMAPGAALAAMEALLVAGDTPHAVVVQADWPRFAAVFSGLPRRLFFEEVVPDGQPAAIVTPPNVGTGPVQPRLTEVVAKLLGHPPGYPLNPQTGFNALGMDSVGTVELCHAIEQEFGVRLPATVAFDYPDILRLSRHLIEALEPIVNPAQPIQPAPEPARWSPPGQSAEELDALVDDPLAELESLLR